MDNAQTVAFSASAPPDEQRDAMGELQAQYAPKSLTDLIPAQDVRAVGSWLADQLEDDGVGLTGLAAIRHHDPSFDLGRFLAGAKGAYEMVVRAFAAGDRETLKNLLAPNVMASFEGAIAEREAAGTTETVEFLHPPRADLERADLRGDTASVTVRFLAEFRSRT